MGGGHSLCQAQRWRRAGAFALPVWLCQFEGYKGTHREDSESSQRGGAKRQPEMLLCGSHLGSALARVPLGLARVGSGGQNVCGGVPGVPPEGGNKLRSTSEVAAGALFMRTQMLQVCFQSPRK